jgi:hypothetical protein
MAHTPGPWNVQTAEKAFCWEINHVPECGLWAAVAEVGANSLGSRKVTVQEAEGNARLIAAAPDLLAALRDIAEGCEQRLRKGKDQGDLDTLRVCRTAIAKAEGRD